MPINAPVRMACVRCGGVINVGTPIERLKMKGTRYAHVGCSRGNPPKSQPGDSKGNPELPQPGNNAPKGWVTEDKFSLPEDAIKRLRGQEAPDGGTDRPSTRKEEDERVDNPEEVRGRDGREQPDGDGSGLDGDDDGDSVPDLFDDIDGPDSDGKEGDGTEGEEGDGEADGEGEEDGDGSDREDGDTGEEEDEAGNNETDGDKDQSKPSGKKQEQKKPPAKPKERNGKLEDLPDDLLLKLAMLAAQMATEKLKGTIEPRLSRILAEVAEPLTAKMAGDFQKKMGDSVRNQLTKEVAETRKEASSTIEVLRKEIDRRVDEEIKRLDGLRPVIHKIEGPGEWEKEFPETELFHFAFDETLKLCGAGFDVFTPGPTGCGKTHMFAQIATALGLDYGIVSGTGGVTETELFGNASPNLMTGENVYQETEFVKLYENGGLFLLDEADGMDANCLLKVNAAIANGYCTIPKRLKNPRAKRHKNFVFALAANTWGHGATRLYCGRNKLDEATLDRFRGGSVPMDYDPNIERRLVGDQKLYRMLAGWRAKITEHNLPRVLSTRFMVQSVKLRAMGYDDDGIARKLCGGWTPGEVEKVIGKRL